MTQANIELLQALRKAGAPEEDALAAAKSVAPGEEVATKADLAALEARLSWKLVGALALFAALVKFTPPL
ncbi:MAG: hypothetical protein OXU61_14095 [Gammaproteobacteria bacterium]|nr:hypothetical protein [Gammaproteobacteria bacterium]MDD9864011.1 hypothetical protein [Gammaproteobacteria bacterium]